jgi:predicted RecB family nuclease
MYNSGAVNAPAETYLTKSRFTAGVRCLKQLWWRVHEPHAPELAPTVPSLNRLLQGTEVGIRAREYMGGGEGVLIDLPGRQLDDRVAATWEALLRGARVLYEPTFTAENVSVRVDMLERLGGKTGGRSLFRLIEVKAATRLKREHIPDVALQVHVLRRAGLDVRHAEVMYLNRECRFPDLADLFVREDVTELVESYLPEVPGAVRVQQAALEGALPSAATGDHCRQPYQCPFIGRCWPARPAHHVSTLYTISRTQALELEARGWNTLFDLPSDLELTATHARQVRAVTGGSIAVEQSLRDALGEFRGRLAFLDFETVALAIPRWTGCRPWEAVPVQFSVHKRNNGRHRWIHHEWIADSPQDPRPELARRLIEACRGADSIVAYYAKFEQACLEHLIRWVPEHAGELSDILARLVDLYPVVRNHVYHPDFTGSFSIKSVLPALVRGMSYADLRVTDGAVATVELQNLMFGAHTMPPAEATGMREALLRYCERDTWAMVRLLERLRLLAESDQLELAV